MQNIATTTTNLSPTGHVRLYSFTLLVLVQRSASRTTTGEITSTHTLKMKGETYGQIINVALKGFFKKNLLSWSHVDKFHSLSLLNKEVTRCIQVLIRFKLSEGSTGSQLECWKRGCSMCEWKSSNFWSQYSSDYFWLKPNNLQENSVFVPPVRFISQLEN